MDRKGPKKLFHLGLRRQETCGLRDVIAMGMLTEVLQKGTRAFPSSSSCTRLRILPSYIFPLLLLQLLCLHILLVSADDPTLLKNTRDQLKTTRVAGDVHHHLVMNEVGYYVYMMLISPDSIAYISLVSIFHLPFSFTEEVLKSWSCVQ